MTYARSLDTEALVVAKLPGMVVLAALSLVGCATSIETTMQKAQRECVEMQALIKNHEGLESVTIRCTWTEESIEW